jgi:hypothetical protein
MIDWLYRYIFRGAGVALLTGVLTILFLVVNQRVSCRGSQPPVPAEAPGAAERR